MKSIVIFGAGKIGRSFIGQIFSKAGYELIFVDINKFLVNEINYNKHYNVIIRDLKDEIIPVYNVRAILLSDEDSILNELDKTTIAAVSVGKKGLPVLINILAHSLERRQHRRPGSPLDLIIAENMRDADGYLRNELKKHLSPGFPLDTNIGLIATSIGKMVPLIREDQINNDSLAVYAEAYNTLIVSKNGFLNPIPEIPELAPKENIKAWADRKLFIHNFGHASLSYLAALKNPVYTFTWEALADKALYSEVFETMKESAAILKSLYPEEFSAEDLEMHIRELLKRFANKSLGDTIYRIGCDLDRKLGHDDRIVPLIRFAIQKKLPYSRILKVLVAGIMFPAVDAKGMMIMDDRRFKTRYNQNIERILQDHCKFDASMDKQIFKEAVKIAGECRQKIII